MCCPHLDHRLLSQILRRRDRIHYPNRSTHALQLDLQGSAPATGIQMELHLPLFFRRQFSVYICGDHSFILSTERHSRSLLSFPIIGQNLVRKVAVRQQYLPERQPGSGQARLHSAQINVQGCRQFLIVQSGNFPQRDNLPVVLPAEQISPARWLG